jgi:membrane protein implicated in regulation of membrane protease activity
VTVRQVQVRGCLPALLALLLVGALLAAVMTASVALAAVALAAALVAAAVRTVRRLAGARDEKTPEARRRAADVTIDAEVVERTPEGADDRPPKRLE